MYDLLEKELGIPESEGATFYIDENFNVVIRNLEEMMERGQDFVVLSPYTISLISATLAQYTHEE